MDNVTLDRLESQLEWYDKRSQQNQLWFKRLKIIQIGMAALIPFTATAPLFTSVIVLPIITGGLGVTIVILEGLQGLYKFHDNWTSYRSIAESLKHEKYLWLAKAGPYVGQESPDVLLAERVESLISTEHAKWVSSRKEDVRKS